MFANFPYEIYGKEEELNIGPKKQQKRKTVKRERNANTIFLNDVIQLEYISVQDEAYKKTITDKIGEGVIMNKHEVLQKWLAAGIALNFLLVLAFSVMLLSDLIPKIPALFGIIGFLLSGVIFLWERSVRRNKINASRS